VLNADNLGFGVANNQGAARATGEYLVFLNDDLFVKEGWLAPLLARMERDRSVGAVGPRVRATDGSVQSAGALLTRSGGTQLYRDAETPFPRIADYVAGACLMMRRLDFAELGGFDPLYHPMYFEDADLCLALRNRGQLVVYEPRSEVTHIGGAAGYARERRPLVPLRNRFNFERRWRHVLSARPYAPLDTPRRRLAARDAPSASRVLVVDATARHASLALELARICLRCQITLAGPDWPAEADRLACAGIEVATVGDWDRWLAERRFHYDAVVRAGSGIRAAIRATQPQAALLGEATPCLLANAGIAVSCSP
jgi:hypothetical protein